jgi:tetratricopeptide (TPR) repeat protein/opacity protein-like surface antigen
MKNSKFTLNAIVLMLAFLMIQGSAYSQETDKDQNNAFARYWYLTLNGGISQFWGDVQDQNPLEKLSEDKFTGGLTIGHQLSPVFGLRGNAQYGGLYSTLKSSSPQQEMEASTVFDYSLQGTVSLINLLTDYKEDRKLDLYGFAGLGFSNWETEWREKPSGTLLGSHGGVSASNGPMELTTEAVIPFGGGISYKLSDGISLGLEQVWKGVNSDFLDAKTGGFDYDIYTNSTLNLTFNLGQFGGFGKMVRDFEQVGFDAEPAVMERHGDDVKVTVSGQIPENYFSSKAAMKLTPKMNYNGKSKVLSPVFLRGEKVSGDGKVITDDGGTFSQDYTIPYEEGMEDAELVLESMVFLPKGNPVNEDATNSNLQENYKSEMLPQKFLAEGTIITGQRIAFAPSNGAENPYDSYGSPDYGMLAEHGYKKETIISDKATIYFKINLAYLNWRLPLNVNRNAKEDVEELKQFIDKGWEIKDIEINAWASPEGEESFNAGLSERRAKTGHKVLKGLFKELDMDIEEVKVNKHAKGEDWNGFMDAVEASDIKDKNIILNVVRSEPDLKKREQEIRNMALVYEKVEEEILPPLRRSEIKINSYEPKKTDDELAQMAMDDAENLSKEELLYGATLHDDLDDKLAVYQKVNELFPGCPKGFNNTGYIHMLQDDYDKAKTAFKKAESIAPSHGGVLNNLGVIAGIEGD